MTQRLARRAEDRFITNPPVTQRPQRRGLLEVSMVTRFPVIGSRMVMGSSLSFRHKANAAPSASIKFACDCGYETVTALDTHIPKADEARMDRLACFMGDC